MQTLTESQITENTQLLFPFHNNEPILLKDDQNHTSLVLPEGKWLDAFLMFYNTLNKSETDATQRPSETKTSKITPTQFYEKWHGTFKGSEDFDLL